MTINVVVVGDSTSVRAEFGTTRFIPHPTITDAYYDPDIVTVDTSVLPVQCHPHQYDIDDNISCVGSFGVSGQTITNVLARETGTAADQKMSLTVLAARKDVDLVIVRLGANDISNTANTPVIIYNNMRKLINLFGGRPVILQQMYGLDSNAANYAPKIPVQLAVNEIYNKISAELPNVYVLKTEGLTHNNGYLLPGISNDGLHLNYIGNRIICQEIKRLIYSIFGIDSQILGKDAAIVGKKGGARLKAFDFTNNGLTLPASTFTSAGSTDFPAGALSVPVPYAVKARSVAVSSSAAASTLSISMTLPFAQVAANDALSMSATVNVKYLNRGGSNSANARCEIISNISAFNGSMRRNIDGYHTALLKSGDITNIGTFKIRTAKMVVPFVLTSLTAQIQVRALEVKVGDILEITLTDIVVYKS